MKTKLFFIASLLAFASILNGQTIFRGTVIDATSKSPIEKAKVGITNQGVGVVSDLNGKFNYKKYHETLSDTDELVVSAPGYKPISIKASEVRMLFNRSSAIELEPRDNGAQNKGNRLKIFWDISEGMQDRDLTKELAFVRQYLEEKGAIPVTLEVFNNVVVYRVSWDSWDGDMERFRESVTQKTYNAPSNYSLLNLAGADMGLLMSNGDPNYGKLAADQNKPIDSYTTTATAQGKRYLLDLAGYTEGTHYENLLQLRQAEAKGMTFKNEQKLLPQAARVKGKLTSLGKPLQGATIVIKGDLKEYMTDVDGQFEIPALEGDLIVIRALGMFPKAVALQEETFLDIEMIPSSDVLDEVVITAKTEQIFVGGKKIRGTNEPNMPGGLTRLGDFYITYKDINPSGLTVEDVLKKKFKGIRMSYTPEGPVLTYFGRAPGLFLNGWPAFHPSQVLSILDSDVASIIMKDSDFSNIKYGGQGERGLQILVTTKNGIDEFKDGKEYLAKNNDYKEELPAISNGVLQGNSEISGTVTSLNKPLQGAEVVRKGSLDIAYTTSDGSFELSVKNGDVLIVSGLGMFTKEIAITDEKEYAVELLPKNDVLDEVVLQGKGTALKPGEVGLDKDAGRYKIAGGGTVNVKSFDRVQMKLDVIADTEVALNGKFANLYVNSESGRPFIYKRGKPLTLAVYVDGFPYPEPLRLSGLAPGIIKTVAVKEDPYGIIPPSLFIDTTRADDKRKRESLLVKGNDYQEDLKDISTTAATITGTVSSPNGPLQGAEVVRKGSLDIAYTKSDGSFELAAKRGDILIVSGLGMFTKEIAITDEKKYAVELLPSSDLLDEVVLNGEKSPKEKLYEKKDALSAKSGFKSTFILREEFENKGYTEMFSLIAGRASGIQVLGVYPDQQLVNIRTGQKYAVAIDGVLYKQDIFDAIDPANVFRIEVTSGLSAAIKYGPEAANGLISVLTMTSKEAFDEREMYKLKSALVKGNDYQEDLKDISTTATKITGTVTSLNGPLQGAEVVRKGSLDIAYTKSDGSFELTAKNGDVLIISGLGMFTKEIAVTDEKEYAVALLPSSDLLDEVVLKGEKTAIEKLYEKKDELSKSSGFASSFILKEEFQDKGYLSLVSVIAGKATSTQQKGVYPNRVITNSRNGGLYAVAIDGVEREPGILEEIQPSTIAMIEVIASPSAGGKYGIQTPNGLISITTQSFENFQNKGKDKSSALVKGNDYQEEVQEISKGTTQITGIIKSPTAPIKGASITKKGSFNEVTTDVSGRFNINASIDEILVISAPNMFPKEILIESQNMEIIELTPKSSDLDEIVLEGRERVDNTVETAYGKTNGDKIGYATGEINTKEYSAGYTSLDQLIKGKIGGVTVNSGLLTGQVTTYKIRGGSQSITNEVAPIWIVNGTPYQDPPEFLDVNQIDNISVLKSVAATSRYGSLAAGGAFIIKTKEVNFEAEAAKNKQSALVSGNEYAGDVTGDIDAALPAYIIRFRKIGTPEKQIALYKRLSRTQESPLEYYVDAAKYFQSLSPELGDEVRSDLAYIARNNTKALRTLSYLYELVEDTQNIVLVNERIAKIAPQEAQSYRDLALAYQNNKEYDKALELYINMLGEQIKGVNFEGLEKPIKNELSRLVALHKDKIDYSRLPNEWLRTDYKVDMRMTIDWSDRSVPFEFQFVNPDKKFFKWTHTLEETRERLQAEQKQGFQTEEFIIDDAPSGEWLINIQYLGNEGDYVLPPFLKYTVYRDYGTPKETKEIRVIKLFKQVDKVTLGRVVM